MKKWIGVIALTVVGILAAIVAIEYLTVPIHSVPTFLGGKHVRGHYQRRGSALLVLAVVAFGGAAYWTVRIRGRAPPPLASPSEVTTAEWDPHAPQVSEEPGRCGSCTTRVRIRVGNDEAVEAVNSVGAVADVEAVGAVADVSDSDERTGWWSHMPFVVRVVSHAAVWVGVLTPMVVIISKGWIATGDNAAIATRSYQALTFHPPLVGLPSAAGIGLGHSLYDPGPLEFWLLAVPVHIDTTNGLFLGASLLGAAVLSVAIEAIWSTKLWLGCALVAFTVLDLLWLTPAVLENLHWKAYFPIPFFIATIALAWVVGTGRFGWWPVMVFVASVASQSHLLFVIPC